MTETEAKIEILELIKKYYFKYKKNDDKYSLGDRIQYSGRIYDEREMETLADSMLEFWLTSGKYTELFEKKLSEFLNIKYSSLVNSGSSANLLAFMTLTSPLLKERAIKRGDEIITVAAGFPTTIAPIIQYGAVPVFVDITIPEYNIDCSIVEQAVTDRTKAVMLAHTMGNPFDINKIKKLCNKYNLWLIEDNCDALGSKFYIDNKWQYTGTIGDIGTSSFYPPHHITMGEGGAVYTNDIMLHKIIRSLRDWGRDCVCPPGNDNFCGHRFDFQYGQLPKGYDHKYVYSHFGYNLKATDMQAAIGCAQLDKIRKFTEIRKHNFERLYNNLVDTKDKLILPEISSKADPSWFGFLVTCRDGVDRGRIIKYLEKNNIQTRMLFAGNIIKHPCFDSIRADDKCYRVIGKLKNTDKVMNNTFWVGVYPGINDGMIDSISNIIKQAIR